MGLRFLSLSPQKQRKNGTALRSGLNWIRSLLVTLLFAQGLVLADQGPTPGGGELQEYMASLDYSCERDSDCVQKDIRNCCGYYPKCVNVATVVKPDLVDRECARLGLAAVCGFAVSEVCICVKQRCVGKRAPR